MYDVAVIGGGPGGSVAAKRCSKHGFRTILLEKKKLPRENVCTGMVMGIWAHTIIRREFGEIPREVLVDPWYLSGHMLHFSDGQTQTVEWPTPIAWRRDLDAWMNQKAKDEGVEIWDRTEVLRVDQTTDECMVTLQTGEEKKTLRTRFIIGSDGAPSTVRKSLFPSLSAGFVTAVRECFTGSLNIKRDHFHWFFPKSSLWPRFDIIHKGDTFLIEGSGIGDLREEIDQTLIPYGFDTTMRPVWRDGCMVPRLHKVLVERSFRPALHKVLLVGDAASLIFPITYEGIGPALKSGVLAAESIMEASSMKRSAAEIYIEKLKPVLDVIRMLYFLSKDLDHTAEKEAKAFPSSIKKAYEEALRVGEPQD